MIKNKNSTEYNLKKKKKSIVNVKVPQAHGEGLILWMQKTKKINSKNEVQEE